MSQRSYNQYCPIAHGLDLIGDRWTLLIVRDLLLGPKRFSDLFAGLPGIGSNLLTERLKALELAGVMVRRTLPPPAPVSLYELTDYGRELEAPLMFLAQWGGQTLGAFQPGQVLSRDTLLLTARTVLRGWPAADPATSYRITLTDAAEHAPLEFHGAGAGVAPGGGAPDHAQIAIALDIATLYGLAGGALDLETAIAQGRVKVSTNERD